MPLLLADPEDSDGNSRAQVAMCGMTSGKLKGVHGAQTVYSLDAYANGEKFCAYETACALLAAVSNAMSVFWLLSKTVFCYTARIPLDRI